MSEITLNGSLTAFLAKGIQYHTHIEKTDGYIVAGTKHVGATAFNLCLVPIGLVDIVLATYIVVIMKLIELGVVVLGLISFSRARIEGFKHHTANSFAYLCTAALATMVVTTRIATHVLAEKTVTRLENSLVHYTSRFYQAIYGSSGPARQSVVPRTLPVARDPVPVDDTWNWSFFDSLWRDEPAYVPPPARTYSVAVRNELVNRVESFVDRTAPLVNGLDALVASLETGVTAVIDPLVNGMDTLLNGLESLADRLSPRRILPPLYGAVVAAGTFVTGYRPDYVLGDALVSLWLGVATYYIATIALERFVPPFHPLREPVHHTLRRTIHPMPPLPTTYTTYSLSSADWTLPSVAGTNSFRINRPSAHSAPLLRAAYDRNASAITACTSDINQSDEQGNTALHFVLQQPITTESHQQLALEALRALLSKGADLSIQNRAGHRPFQLAIDAQKGYPRALPVLQEFLDQGADRYIEGSNGQSLSTDAPAEDFTCVIGLEKIEGFPVLDPTDGRTLYNSEAILTALERRVQSPMNRQAWPQGRYRGTHHDQPLFLKVPHIHEKLTPNATTRQEQERTFIGRCWAFRRRYF